MAASQRVPSFVPSLFDQHAIGFICRWDNGKNRGNRILPPNFQQFPAPGMVGVEILRVKKLNLLAVVRRST
jgi:hypothetical protein